MHVRRVEILELVDLFFKRQRRGVLGGRLDRASAPSAAPTTGEMRIRVIGETEWAEIVAGA